MLKFEGKNVSFLLNDIEKKEISMRNNKFYQSVPVVLTKNLIRIFNIEMNEIITLEYKNLEDEETKSFPEFLEKKLGNYIEKVVIMFTLD